MSETHISGHAKVVVRCMPRYATLYGRMVAMWMTCYSSLGVECMTKKVVVSCDQGCLSFMPWWLSGMWPSTCMLQRYCRVVVRCVPRCATALCPGGCQECNQVCKLFLGGCQMCAQVWQNVVPTWLSLKWPSVSQLCAKEVVFYVNKNALPV